MLFYKAEGTVRSGMTSVERGYSGITDSMMFSQLSDTFYHEHKEQIYIFVSMLRQSKIILGIMTNSLCDIFSFVDKYLKNCQIEAYLDICEITIPAFSNILSCASRMNFIPDTEYVASLFDMECLKGRNKEPEDKMIKDCRDRELIFKYAGQTLCELPLTEELDRIYKGKTYNQFMGNPVHYIIRADAKTDVSCIVCETLLMALYANKRIISRRYTTIDLNIKKQTLSSNEITAVYQANTGGAVYVSIPFEDERRGFFGSADTVTEIVRLCDIAKHYSKKVLTIFGVDINCKAAVKKVYECMENTSFVEIDEKAVFADKAKDYLTGLANKNYLTTDEKLYSYVKNAVAYNAGELNRWYMEWSDRKMKTEIFPQYKDTVRSAAKIKSEGPKGSAYEELQNMIGLDEVKNVVDKVLNYYKAQKMFRARGLKTNSNAMHMVFTGNPGTAKTTVARLFAQIMKDNGILSVGNLVEVGRADLVGQFVGQTAPLVKAKFKAAQGSVLFIDEAYSLLDGDHNTFGTEAINTIVAEMENRREDIIVIFAGYPKEIEEFLAKNPGMNSRIVFHINFNDYSAEELYEITELMAKKQDMCFAENVKEKLISVYEAAREEKGFGNGRYARNIFEKALMDQGARLICENADTLSNAEMQLIIADDIDIDLTVKQKRAVGFVV